MRYFKKLVGENIYLSPASVEDIEKYTEWLNDFGTTDYTGRSGYLYSIEFEKSYLEKISNDKERIFAIIDLKDDKIIGGCGIHDINNINRTATLGIFIGETEERNKGGLKVSEIFNVSTNPHVRSKDTTQTIMRDVLIALAPASIFGIYNFGVQALIRIIVGIVVCMASEAVYEYFMHKKITVMDLSAAVTGLLIALNIPSTLNIGFEIVGCVFAIIIVKQLFGGIGQNFMNPALAARCFLLIAYTGPMTNFVCDAYSGATPLAILKPGSEVVGQTAPTLLTMFIGKTSGVIGETSVICLLIGAIYLVVRKIISLRIPLSYIGTFAVLIFLFAPGHQFDAMYMLQEICGGGLILGAFFMATDYVTSPITPNGKLVFGVCLGLLTFIFRMFGGSAEGVSYAIIFCNLLVPLIERVTVPKSFGKKKPEKKAKEAA